ncbi:MAG: response regulator [Bacilli bacterium]|nr:response regulator [Bacilli bacterium]
MKDQRKNKLTTLLIVAINVIFVIGLFFAEFQYISSTRRQTIDRNEQSFKNTNVSLVSMTNNYLVGERNLCRSWSNYLNNDVQTMEDAIDFVRTAITDTDVMGHIVYKTKTKLTGYSTKASSSNPSDFRVDYSSISSLVFTSEESGVRVSSSYINPINGSPSIAFYNDIKLKDPDDNSQEVDAYLLRVVLRDNFKQRWTFPSGSFKNLQVTLIDKDGNYIISGKSFRGSNFFAFYRSYNKANDETIANLKQEVTTNSGIMKMFNAVGEECYIAYSHLSSPVDWIILTYTPASDITSVPTDWLLISILAIGLVALFIIDLSFLLKLNKNLVETAKVADSANKAKTDFLSTMSHDIRTPINAIIGFTALAKNEQNNPTSTQDSLKKIELASNHLLTLINDILDLSKIESGAININYIDFSIVDIFENLLNISQPMVKSKNINFSFRVHNCDNEWLFADKLRLSQIFTNLSSNALKYTPENGNVFIDVEEQPSDKEGYVKLIYRVQDTGIGMSQEFVDRMYEPFSRATDSRVNSIQGTGLGLAITKRMVDIMGGTIDCQSELGKGTTFTVTLDIKIAEREDEKLSLPETNILLVDSDDAILESASNTLISLGAKVDIASSGKDALEKAKDNQYRVVITNYKLTDMSGLDLIKEIKKISHGELDVLMSTYDWSDVEKESKDENITDLIFKPFFRSVLYEKIIEVVNPELKSSVVKEEETYFNDINVLVTEDNEINWEIISSLLEMYGVTSERAENGKVALNLLEDANNDGKWDIVFMDIQMPVMNGLDATRAIRKIDREYTKNVPIIAMTADAFSENVIECLNAGMNGHIAKPIDINLVLNEIRKIHAKKNK